MSITNEQITNLLSMVSSVKPDQFDCDGCHGRIAEFAEMYLAAQELPAAMQSVKNHMEQCLCCKDEFNALLKGLEAIEG